MSDNSRGGGAAMQPLTAQSPAHSRSGQRGGPTTQSSIADAEQVEYLKQVIQQAKVYGRDIEGAVEHLADLLTKKTLECEGLRALASENYSSVRQAVQTEYQLRVRAEVRQEQEIRTMQSKCETMSIEKQRLENEVAALRALVKELEATPPHAPYNPKDSSLFNRVLAGTKDGSALASTTSSWNMPTGDGAPPEGNRMDLINYLWNIEPSAADQLDSAGVFDFLRLVACRCCQPLPGSNGLYPELNNVVTQVLRERREAGTGLPTGAQRVELEDGIPVVNTTEKRKCIQLWRANKPNAADTRTLEILLSQYSGREAELYAVLQKEFAADDAKRDAALSMLAQKGLTSRARADAGQSPSAISSASNALAAGGPGGADNTAELHGRIILMYRKYNPAKISGKELSELLIKYPPEVLLSSLIDKYGPEPTAKERRELIKQIVE
mgnify:FL=1